MQELEINKQGLFLKIDKEQGECFNEESRNIHKKAQIGGCQYF
ncbi:hypothetical protein ACT7DC_07225 [Bacillus cereus]